MKWCSVLFLARILLLGQASLASPVPSPQLLLESWQQLDADVGRILRSYKLEGVVTTRPHGLNVSRSTEKWRVWHNGERFLWERKAHYGGTYVCSFDGARYYHYYYLGGVAHGFVYQAGKQSPPNAFGAIFPFDIRQMLQKPLAGGHWQDMPPYYLTLLQYPSALTVEPAQDGHGCVLRLSGRLKNKMPLMPDEIHFKRERERFVPTCFVLRDNHSDNRVQQVFEITSARWYKGCWIPTGYRWKAEDASRSRLLVEATAALRVYDINKAIDAKHFRFEFPVGTLVTDERGQEQVIRDTWLRSNVWFLVVISVAFLIAVIWTARRMRPQKG